MKEKLRATGDKELSELLLADREIVQAIERFERRTEETGARFQLLGTSIRLTPAMAPDIHEIFDGCRKTLGLDSPVESFVYPGSSFNAAAIRPERGRLLIVVSSSLLEGFEPEELRFVAGHELGHHLFEHHRIPLGPLLDGQTKLAPALILQLFAWQRYAEISADRAGLVCAGGLDPAARSLFKLASGLRGGRINVRIDQFMAQVGELREEMGRMTTQTGVARSDWFSTHPFSPLRLQAAELFSRSEVMGQAMSREELESQVQDLMTLMRPSYLQERSGIAESMRRLLFAGGVAIASASGKIKEEELAELERLLGPGSLPPEVKPDVIQNDLPSRVEDVKKTVPPLRRAQVIRDLCVIARADGCVEDAELDVIRGIATAIEVDDSVIAATLRSPGPCH